MKNNIFSNILKVLLILFSIVAILFGIYVLPTIASEQLELYPELSYARLPVLLISESLLVLLLVGIGVIVYLLIVFDRGLTFSSKFTKGLEILVGMCILASIGIMILFYYINSIGRLGLLLGFTMAATTIFTWILASVIMLIRAIVKNAITYKTDYDLTV